VSVDGVHSCPRRSSTSSTAKRRPISRWWLYYANGQSPQNWFASLAPNASGAPSGTIADSRTYTITNQASDMSLGQRLRWLFRQCQQWPGGHPNGR
jgi:hypothetical protein